MEQAYSNDDNGVRNQHSYTLISVDRFENRHFSMQACSEAKAQEKRFTVP
jgi:hypothetical protein